MIFIPDSDWMLDSPTDNHEYDALAGRQIKKKIQEKMKKKTKKEINESVNSFKFRNDGHTSVRLVQKSTHDWSNGHVQIYFCCCCCCCFLFRSLNLLKHHCFDWLTRRSIWLHFTWQWNCLAVIEHSTFNDEFIFAINYSLNVCRFDFWSK